MKLSQLRAISYKQAQNNEQQRRQEIEKAGVQTIFRYQTLYKTTYHFLNNYKNKIVKLYYNAYSNIINKIHELQTKKTQLHERYKNFLNNPNAELNYNDKLEELNQEMDELRGNYSILQNEALKIIRGE